MRDLRENIHMRVLNQSANKKPQKSPADLADLRRRNPREHIYFIRYYEKEIIMDTAINEKPLPSRGKAFERHTRLCESPFNDS